jgi:hypothetical protein
MKKTLVLIAAAMLIAAPLATALATDDIKPVPIPIPPSKIDLAGTWNYSSSAQKVTGKCPAGVPPAGTAKVVQKGKAVTLQYTSGAVCVPPTVCKYDDSLDGNQLTLNNHAVVDDEGGSVTNALGLVVASNESINGLSSSRYVHPGGMECHWESKVNFSRKLEEKK